MPTGYTSALYDGTPQTFDDFALNCARAFGALVLIRDSAGPIPEEFETAEWYQRHVDEALARLTLVESWTPAEADVEQQRRLEEDRVTALADKIERGALRERYEAMLEDVLAWTPPSPDHDGLKTFMEEQLRTSIEHDCTDYGDQWRLKAKAPEEYLLEQLEKAGADLTRARSELAKEVERTNGRNLWLRLLRTSLTMQAATP